MGEHAAAVVAIKSFHRAKQRLCDLPSPQRQLLAARLADNVVKAVVQSEADIECLLVGEEDARRLAVAYDCRWLPEPVGGGLNAALALGLKAVGCKRTRLVLMADLPGLTPAAVADLLGFDAADVALYRSAAGTGTNAVRLRPGVPFAPRFGPNSLARHLSTCRGQRLSVAVVDDPRLALDIDTPDDLALAEREGWV